MVLLDLPTDHPSPEVPPLMTLMSSYPSFIGLTVNLPVMRDEETTNGKSCFPWSHPSLPPRKVLKAGIMEGSKDTEGRMDQ